MKPNSTVPLVYLFFCLAFVVLIIPVIVVSRWGVTTRHVEKAARSLSDGVHYDVLAHVENVTELAFPTNAVLSLAKFIHSDLNATKPSPYVTETKVAPHLFLAFKTLHLRQISYFGFDGSIYSYYVEDNQTFVLFSNTTKNLRRISTIEKLQNASIVHDCYIQQVYDDAGKWHGGDTVSKSVISIDSNWLKVASNSSEEYPSIGRAWGKTQELLFLSTVSMKGLGVVSLGFPVNAIKDVISGIDLHGGSLYLATKDGTILFHTGPYSVELSNNIVTIIVTKSIGDQGSEQNINISCESSQDPLRRENVDINGRKYMFYCVPLDIAGIPSVSIMVSPHNQFENVVHKHSKTAMVLLIVLLVSLTITVFTFVYVIVRTARSEMFFRAALIKQREATQQAERKSMNKSSAFASASHDIRSSLAGLDGIITLSSLEVAPNSEVHKNLEQMRTFTADLVGLLNSVLDTSKIEAGKMQLTEQEFYMSEFLEESVNLYYPVGQDKGIDLVLDPCDGSVIKHGLVQGDRVKLKQILNNLLHNAIKFTSEGHIVVRAWAKKPSLEDSILSSKSTGLWSYLSRFLYKNNDLNSCQAPPKQRNSVEFVIEVDDTGKGIPREKQKSVFEDFVQVNDKTLQHEGTGLGLGIVQSLVRLMGGDIGIVDKDLGERGTCFRFNIFLSSSVTTSVVSAPEGEDSGALVDRIQGNLSQMSELNIRNPSSRSEGSHVVLFIQEGERRRILQRFMQSFGAKVSNVDQLEHLFPTLERIKHKWHLAHLSASGKSDFGSFSESLSTPRSLDLNLGTKDVFPNVRDGSDYSVCLQRKASSKSTGFLLILIDFSAFRFSDNQFLELQSILESLKKDKFVSRCKVVWLYTPKVDIETRKMDEKKLVKCELVVSKPLHGSRLYQVLTLLPEFGGASTIQGYKSYLTEEATPLSTNIGPSTSQSFVRSGSGTPRTQSHREIQEGVQRGGTQKSTLLAGKNFLVVDDNPVLRMVALKLLEEHGATVELCMNGEDALNQVSNALRGSEQQSSKHPYDFILMDCEMPVMNGFEAARQIRLEEKQYNVRVPIIALTAHDEGDIQAKILLAGIDMFVSKPLNGPKLLEAIHSISPA